MPLSSSLTPGDDHLITHHYPRKVLYHSVDDRWNKWTAARRVAALTAGAEPPVNLDPSWRVFPLGRNGKPLPGRTLAAHPDYWRGLPPSWPDLTDRVGRGNTVGLLVHASNLVVLDCDVRAVDGDGYRLQGSSATWVGARWHHGLEDLRRVAAEHGEALPPTFAVRTRSGGFHLYYRRPVRSGITSKGHRDRWLVDVKASRNSWVVTAPSAGYEVVNDLPVAALPGWLARWLGAGGLERELLPLGGERGDRLRWTANRMRVGVRHGETWTDSGDGGDGPGDLLKRWVEHVLALVTLTNKHGGWNNEIYTATLQLLEAGLDRDEVAAMVLGAAAPVDDREHRRASDTVRSAWRRHLAGDDANTRIRYARRHERWRDHGNDDEREAW